MISRADGYDLLVTTPRPASTHPAEWAISDVPADPSDAAAVRHAFAQWLAGIDVDTHARRDITLAVYEALANAVEHAYDRQETSGTMTIRAAYFEARGVLHVWVSDRGQWRPPTPSPLRGNGIPLMNALSGDTVIDRTEHGTTVGMTFPVHAAQHS